MADDINAQVSVIDTEAGLQVQTADVPDEDFDKERALSTIKTQREAEKALKSQLSAAQARLKEFEAKEKEAAEAELGELEKARKRIDELMAAHSEAQETLAGLRLRQSFSKIASQLDVSFVNAQAEDDAFELVDLSNVKVDPDGKVEGLEAALKQLVKTRPYLFGDGSAANGTPKPKDRNQPTINKGVVSGRLVNL